MRALVLVLILSTGLWAGDVKEQYINMGSGSVDGTTVSTQAAGGADKNSVAVPVYDSEFQAIAYKYVAANAGSSFTLTIEIRTLWGDWIEPDTAQTVTCAGASGSGIVDLDLPVCSEIRVVQSSDATYATTLTACTINKY